MLRFLAKNTTVGDDETNDASGGRDAYEFVAFLLWYMFLLICCVVPTCCAYRRRRLMEARLAQQQTSFDQLHHQNFIILSNIQLRPDMDGEEAQKERTKRIVEALKPTTFSVQEKDITEKEDEEMAESTKNSTEEAGDEESGPALDPESELDPELALESEVMDRTLLSLPSDAPHGVRTVPGGCAICLCAYESGDEVSWSKEASCKHAFHTACIIPWLAKKNENQPKCPCCRQAFCSIERITVANLTMTPFGLIPSSLISGGSSFVFEEGIMPSPDLTASMTENGFLSLQPSFNHRSPGLTGTPFEVQVQQQESTIEEIDESTATSEQSPLQETVGGSDSTHDHEAASP